MHCSFEGGVMARYRQYCPIARATEILAERWSLLIRAQSDVRGDHVLGDRAGRADDVALDAREEAPRARTGRGDHVDRETERSGLDLPAHRCRCRPCAGDRQLGPMGRDLGRGASRAHRSRVCAVGVVHGAARSRGPAGGAGGRGLRVSRRASGATSSSGCSFQSGDAEVCATDPGGEADLRVIARSAAFVDWHRGALSWSTGAPKRRHQHLRQPRTSCERFPRGTLGQPILA